MSRIASFINVTANNACIEARKQILEAKKMIEKMAKDKQCDDDDRHAIQLNLSHLNAALDRL